MANPQSKKELRAWLEKKRGRTVPGRVWDSIWRKAPGSDVIDGEMPLDMFLEFAQREIAWKRLSPGRKEGSVTRQLEIEGLVPDWEIPRSRLVSEHLAWVAANHPSVVDFRPRVLKGQILSVEQAEDLLNSVAPRYLSSREFELRGIPLIGHKSHFGERSGPDEFKPAWDEDSVIWIEWDGQCEAVDFTWDQHITTNKERTPVLKILGETGTVLAGSVFQELRRASRALASYQHYEEEDATWFILTGERPPALKAISAQIKGGYSSKYARAQIVIHVDAWVSPETVKSIYRHAQQQIMGKQSSRIDARKMALAKFHSEYVWGSQKRKPWADRMNEWNEVCTDKGWMFHKKEEFKKRVIKSWIDVIHPAYKWRRNSREV